MEKVAAEDVLVNLYALKRMEEGVVGSKAGKEAFNTTGGGEDIKKATGEKK